MSALLIVGCDVYNLFSEQIDIGRFISQLKSIKKKFENLKILNIKRI